MKNSNLWKIYKYPATFRNQLLNSDPNIAEIFLNFHDIQMVFLYESFYIVDY